MDGFRPPQYAPGQSPELMNDPMSLMAMMIGIPMAQSMAGPGHFIPHLQPNQNLSDQFLASRYQRDMMSSLNWASSQGNAAVASRLLGVRSLVTDAPATQLNREQANNIAGLINNPIAKAIAGSAIGPENFEALAFGSRGDPSALAGSTNRMGFFRRDTMGGKRMSERSLEDFSQNVYQTLYGKDANVDEMRGFMASQTGSMMEELFQRGALPQAMGDMSAADRVKMISRSGRDDKTVTRLAEQFGHRDMLERNEKYQKATEEERKLMLSGQLDTYKGKIRSTFEAADAFTRGDPRAKSAQDIEAMEGYGTAARNVDASRVSQVAKKYTGALDAVREIFGDSGRSGSIQELMTALDAFAAGGAIGTVNVSKVEGTVRQMRVAARNAGVGVDQVMQIQGSNMALAQTMGLSPELARGLTVQNLQMMQAMRDSNVSRGRFGEMNQAQAQQMMQTRMARGEASGVGKSMAALARAYTENPELYKGTELEAAVQAYNDPKSNNTYTFGGKTVNLAELAGRGGPQALSALAQRSGMDQATFRAFFMDKGTQEYQKEGFAFQAQRYQAARDISNRAIRGNVTSRTMSDAVRALKPADMSAGDFERQTNDMSAQLSAELGRTIIEDTGDMTQKERAEYLERKHVDMIREIFISRGVDKRTAQRQAEAFSKAAFGDTQAKRRQAFSGIAAEANTVLDARTGTGIVGNDMLYNQNVQKNYAERRVNDADEAERANRAEIGNETNVLQRVGDTLDEMGRDPNMTGAEAARRIVAPVRVREARDKLAPELKAGMHAAEGMLGADSERAQKNAETILKGLYDGRNASAVQAGVGALANQVFGTDKKDADAKTVQLMQKAAGGDAKAMAQVQARIEKQYGRSAEGKEKTKQAMDMMNALRDAKHVDLQAYGHRAPTAAEHAAEQAALRSVGAENVPRGQVAGQVAYHQADGPFQAMPASVTMSPADIAAVQAIGADGGPISGDLRMAQNAAIAAAMAAAYGAPAIANAGTDSVGGMKTYNAILGAGEMPGMAANAAAGSKVLQKVAPGAAAKAGSVASRLAPYAGAARVAGKISTVAAPVLGALTGGLEAESAGRSVVGGAVLGALTGDAKTGSVMSKSLGIEKGSTADKSLGVLGAMASGALTFGAVGAGFFGFGAIPAALAGAAIGGMSELYKIATEDPSVNAKQTAQQVTHSQRAIQQTIDASPQMRGHAGAGGGAEMNINGVLSLRGLQEAILSASGQAPLDTPDGGAPVFNGNVAGGVR